MITLPADYEKNLLSSHLPSLRYDGRSDFAAWQETARAKLRELLGIDRMGVCPPAITEREERAFEGFDEIKFKVETEPGFFSCCRLRIPAHTAGAKLPLVICLQGHTTGEHISVGIPIYPGDEADLGGDRDIANQALAHGFCALTVEQRGMGQLGGTPKGPACHVPAMSALLMGRTILGERVWDIMRDLDAVLENFDAVDPDRILCMGGSGGGTATCYASCLDTRIRYSVPVCAVCTFKASIAAMKHCVCNFVPRIAEYFDMGDLCGLIAPRTLIVVHGMEDPIFPKKGVFESYEILRSLYAASGAPDACALISGPGGHRQYAAPTWEKILSEMAK